jgi:putative endonuclease
MMSNKTRSTLYIGVTSDLSFRISQHRRGEIPGFTRRTGKIWQRIGFEWCRK